MLFLVFGSSASGKTFALEPLRRRLPDLVVHDFDEIGVPAGPDLEWRLRSNKAWLETALEHQQAGRDMLLAGNTPIGELMDSPSAPHVDGIAACLLDCDDATRIERLRARGEAWLARAGTDLEAYLAWAERLRRHAADPGRHVHTIDTTRLSVEQVVDELVQWIHAERRLTGAPAET